MRMMLIAAAMLLPVAGLAQEQARALPQPPTDSNILLNAPGILPSKKRPPGLPDVKASPLAWPRLDPGAVICRSEDDLARLAERRRGDRVEGSLDCQVVRAVTPIAIVQRKSPGMTQIKTNDAASGGLGWTDAWLPEKAPVSAKR
jgi:hypothetical protein